MVKNGNFGRPNGGLGWILGAQIIGQEFNNSGTKGVADEKALKKAVWDMVRHPQAANAGGYGQSLFAAK